MQFKKVLVTVKAYPNPSKKYGETICVAGIDLETNKWIRLYPIPYRDLDEDQKFPATLNLRELGLNERQIEALRLMVNEGISFSNREYRKEFNVSNQTFVRDMKTLTELDFVTTAGVGRSLKYKAKQ